MPTCTGRWRTGSGIYHVAAVVVRAVLDDVHQLFEFLSLTLHQREEVCGCERVAHSLLLVVVAVLTAAVFGFVDYHDADDLARYVCRLALLCVRPL